MLKAIDWKVRMPIHFRLNSYRYRIKSIDYNKQLPREQHFLSKDHDFYRDWKFTLIGKNAVDNIRMLIKNAWIFKHWCWFETIWIAPQKVSHLYDPECSIVTECRGSKTISWKHDNTKNSPHLMNGYVFLWHFSLFHLRHINSFRNSLKSPQRSGCPTVETRQ